MQKQKRKHENKINFIKSLKYGYMDAFLVLAAVMTIGVLLAVSTLAQERINTDQSPGSFVTGRSILPGHFSRRSRA